MSRSYRPARQLSADQLNAALIEVGGQARPAYLTDIVAQAGRTRQRPAWTFPERWLPMPITLRPAAVPRVAFLILLMAALLALLGATYLFFGSQNHSPRIFRNGLIAFAYAGDIYVAEPDGSGRRTLVSAALSQPSPSWSPDGSRLAYWSANTSGGQDLVVVDADGSHPVKVASGVIEPTGIGPAWSPDGKTIAYSARIAQGGACAGFSTQNGDFCFSRIFLAASDGTGSRQVGDAQLDARSPAWSPDGSTIAFGGGNASQEVRLYLMKADGTNVHRLGTVRGTDWAFVAIDWSPSGAKIAGQAGAADNISEWDIWVVAADGSSESNVGAHPGGDEIVPSWAPDRDALAWYWNGIVLLEPGGAPVDLLPSAGIPTWSPDGKLLATVMDSGELKIIDPQGNLMATVDGVAEAPVSWQPVPASR
jgi:dipeptidyl aminopeptidase/acylaminoacyl peptidase